MKNFKKIFIITSLILVLSLVVFYSYYTGDSSSDNILNNIINRKGYSLELVTEQVPIKIFIKPEWIAWGQKERKELNIKTLELQNTNIILDNVWNRGNDIYFSFSTSFNINKKGGEFLYNGYFNDEGNFTNPSGSIELFDINGNQISVGQTGTGPEAAFSFGIRPEEQKFINEGFYVEYNGYNLYEYSKK